MKTGLVGVHHKVPIMGPGVLLMVCPLQEDISFQSFFYFLLVGSVLLLTSHSIIFHLTEDKIWTEVQHNSTGLTRVQGAGPEKPYTMSLNYSSSAEQLEAVISSAENCEQEVAYHCRRSRLLNTPSKCHQPKPFLLNSYWLYSR